METEITSKPAFSAVGYLWEGTYEDAAKGEIRSLLARLQATAREIPTVTGPSHIIGVSWNDRPNGFRYFVGIEIRSEAAIPADMTRMNLPSSSYLSYDHSQGIVADSYRKMFEIMKAQGLEHDASQFTYLEEYPFAIDPFGKPKLRLLIPLRLPVIA